MMSVRSNCPVEEALMRKYVESSSGQRTPFGTYTKEPSVNTAEVSAAKKLSLIGTTGWRYFFAELTRAPLGHVHKGAVLDRGGFQRRKEFVVDRDHGVEIFLCGAELRRVHGR